MSAVVRKKYLAFLKNWQDKAVIKVVSGVRRSGKSTLFDLFRQELYTQGIAASQILNLNFETRETRHIRKDVALENYIFEQLDLNKKNYVFLDEIQMVHQFEHVINALFVEPNIDLYVTGSNAYFLSGEFATLLSGRFVELKILPLSFHEYVSWHQQHQLSKKHWTLAMYYEKYIKSTFPFTLNLENEGDIKTYLEGIYASVVTKDVLTRQNLSDVKTLDSTVQFLFSVIGSKISVNKIKNTLASNGNTVAHTTISKQLHGLKEALLFYPTRAYNIRGKKLLTREEKYYAVDVGLRQIVLPDAQPDSGHVLENIIYLELLRRHGEVFTGKFDDLEIDFVISKNGGFEYYQVALSTLDEKTLARELKPLQKLTNSYPKYLLTLDEIDKNTNYNGIQKRHALEWLMEV